MLAAPEQPVPVVPSQVPALGSTARRNGAVCSGRLGASYHPPKSLGGYLLDAPHHPRRVSCYPPSRANTRGINGDTWEDPLSREGGAPKHT
jgi:hypothetical protein